MRPSYVLVLFLALTGCGKSGDDQPKGEAKGRVTFLGEPVTEGTVALFNSQQGIEFEAPIQADGAFVIKATDGVPVAEYVVTVRPLRVFGNPPGDKSAPYEMDKDVPNVPEKYRQTHSSPIRVAIQPGANDLKVEMAP